MCIIYSNINTHYYFFVSACKRPRSEEDSNPTAESNSSLSPTPAPSTSHSHTPLTSPMSPPSHLPPLPLASSPLLPPPPPLNSTSPHTSLASPPTAASPHHSATDLNSSSHELNTSERDSEEPESQVIKTDRQSPCDLDTSQTSQSGGAIDTLMKLFPGRRVPVLEAVLIHCGGDVLRAIQTLLYSSPVDSYINGNNSVSSNAEAGNGETASPSQNRVTNRNPGLENSGTRSSFPPLPQAPPPPPPTVDRSPEPRHYDFFQDPNSMLRTPPFNPLAPSALGRFPYSPHHAFLGLPYSPFLPPRPDYYPPLNLSAHQPVPPPLSPSAQSNYPPVPHSSSSPPPQDQSPAPSSAPDPDSD